MFIQAMPPEGGDVVKVSIKHFNAALEGRGWRRVFEISTDTVVSTGTVAATIVIPNEAKKQKK